MAAEPFPTPPFPDRGDKLLHVVVETAARALEAGKVDVHGALMHAAVHGWMEGHLQGEECDANCVHDYRWHPQEEPPAVN
jgi:hypothetical protein